jgi:hypothetical protein
VITRYHVIVETESDLFVPPDNQCGFANRKTRFPLMA